MGAHPRCGDCRWHASPIILVQAEDGLDRSVEKIMRLCREELLPVSFHSSNLARCAVRALVPLLIVGAAALASGSAAARPAPESFAELAEKLLPSVVNISTTQTLKS